MHEVNKLLNFIKCLSETKEITYKEAKEQKLKFFFLLVPCKHGHIYRKYISGGSYHCCECKRISAYKTFLSNKDTYYEKTKQWYKNNPDKAKQVRKRKYDKWYAQPNNKKKLIPKTAKYRAKKLQATPPWVDFEKINEIYFNCPKEFVVDHIIPLQGETVCGLHVPWNLQYLTPIENSSKKNKLLLSEAA